MTSFWLKRKYFTKKYHFWLNLNKDSASRHTIDTINNLPVNTSGTTAWYSSPTLIPCSVKRKWVPPNFQRVSINAFIAWVVKKSYLSRRRYRLRACRRLPWSCFSNILLWPLWTSCYQPCFRTLFVTNWWFYFAI